MSTRLFAPWLLTGELPRRKVDSVRERLVEALRFRPFPLHINVLWNVLYWDWVPESRSYEHLADTDLIERRDPKTIENALPVGAFVGLHPGQKLLWGEIVYKERIVDADEPNVCPWEVSVDGLAPTFDECAVRERLVVDFETSLMAGQARDVELETHRRRMLDTWGHLLLRTRYSPGDAALDDGAFFVEYLLRRHGVALIREFTRSDLGEEETRGALLQSLHCVRDILAATPGLRCWGDFWFTEEAFRAEASFHDGLDRNSTLLGAMVRLPTRQRVAYHAVSLALTDYARRGGQDHCRRLLAQTEYVARVCHTNAYVAGKATAGDSYAVREVARRASGGIWRSERITPGAPPAYLALPAHIELPFGRRSDEIIRTRAAELLKAEVREAGGTVSFKAKRRSFDSPLSQPDIDAGRLRLDRAVELFATDTVRFQLIVPHTDVVLGEADEARVDRNHHLLLGIDWYDRAYPGLFVCGTVPEGAQRLDAYVRVLAEPVRVDGAAEPLPWAFDHQLWKDALREVRSLPPEEKQRASSTADLLSTAFRRAGVSEGSRLVASLPDLYYAIVGLATGLPPDLDFAELLLGELIASPLVSETGNGHFAYEARSVKGVSSHDRTTLAAWREGEGGRRMREAVYTAESWVQPFYIRRCVYKHRSTWESARSTFKEAARRDGAYKYMHMTDLPEGYSYTRRNVHHRRKGKATPGGLATAETNSSAPDDGSLEQWSSGQDRLVPDE